MKARSGEDDRQGSIQTVRGEEDEDREEIKTMRGDEGKTETHK